MTEQITCEVLIVGLGPVGATLAALLSDARVDVLAIDKSTEIYPLPRAVHFDHEIMRVFQQLRLVDEVMRHARPAPTYEFRTASGEILMSFEYRADLLTPSGWATGYMFNQPGLELALRNKLEASAHARMMLGAEFDHLRIVEGGAECAINGSDGPVRVTAQYVVGCDGASSPVRSAISGALQDLEFDEPWLVVDVIPQPDTTLPELNLQICDPARPTTCVQSGPGRHRWEIMLLPGETAQDVLNDAFIQSQMAKWDVDVEIERKAVYRFHGLVAERWRSGPLLIAGDAAHQTPPFAGQGMCAGIRDAANLSWKLAAVLRGRAQDRLLDSYQIEREPNARAYIQLAIDMGRVVCTLDPQMARGRDEQLLAARKAGLPPIPPAAPPPLTGPCILEHTPGAGELLPQPVARINGEIIRFDDRLGPGAWLIGAAPTEPVADGIEIVDLTSQDIAPFGEQLSSWLQARDVNAALVRPDRQIFGSGAPDRLLQSWAAALGVAAVPETIEA